MSGSEEQEYEGLRPDLTTIVESMPLGSSIYSRSKALARPDGNLWLGYLHTKGEKALCVRVKDAASLAKEPLLSRWVGMWVNYLKESEIPYEHIARIERDPRLTYAHAYWITLGSE